MLQLNNITKHYKTGEKVVNALNGVTVTFNDRELTAVLGSSGCGKTTLMNIIGGLDRSTTGELIIDGVSTKDYKDGDWNNYRNHQIGFVFQSYNLIPHMTVFSNVELALTLSGVSPKERKKRVLDALERVGLSDQVHKKPNQMSGGQMQRVAIARAIVNNPKILLADEPTGAVDSKTGIQIMEILKEISKDCLVVIVTHNQELADQYADRIIRMQDGLIISDDKNVQAQAKKVEEAPAEKPAAKKKRAKMGFLTAAKLSFNNLINKKGRSIITIISGAISVICIALILAMNSGFGYYIADFERNNLSRYPIKVTTQTTSIIDLLNQAFTKEGRLNSDGVNLNSMLDLFKEEKELREKYTDEELIFLSKLVLGVIEKGISGFQNLEDFEFENEFEMLSEIFGVSLGSDIIEFMKALEEDFNPEWGAIMRNYNLDFTVYRKENTGDEYRLNPVDIFISFLEESGFLGILKIYAGSAAGGINSMLYGKEMQELREMFDKNNPWSMMIDDAELLNLQYDILAGRLPDFDTDNAKNEIVLVVDEFNQLDDFTLFMLGAVSVESFILSVVNEFRPLLPPRADEMINLFIEMLLPEGTEPVKPEYDFSEFVGDESTMPATFVLRIPTDYYALDEETGIYNTTGDGIEVEVVGILRLKEGLNAGVISGAIGYTEALATALINKGNESPIMQALKAAEAEYDRMRELLMSTAQRFLALNLNPDTLSNITMPERIGMLMEVAALWEELGVTSEQFDIIGELAALMVGFSFTPENQAVIDKMLPLLAALELPEKDQTLIFEAIELLAGLNDNTQNIDALITAANILSQLEPNEENIEILLSAANLLSGLNPSEENIDAVMQIAVLLSELKLSEENLEALKDAAVLAATLSPNSQNIMTLIEIGTIIAELNLSGTRAQKTVGIIGILSRLNFAADSALISEIFETAEQLAQTPDDPELIFEMAALINELTGENAAVLAEALPLILDLGLTYDEILVLADAAELALELGLSSENMQTLIDIAVILNGMNLSEQNSETLKEAVALLALIELSENNKEILWDTLDTLLLLDISEQNAEILLQAAGVLSEISISQNDWEIYSGVFNKLSLVEITDEHKDAVVALAGYAKELNLDSEDMLTLREAAALLSELNVTRAQQAVLWQLIPLVNDLGITEEDIANAEQALNLFSQIELSEEELAAVEGLITLFTSSEANDDPSAFITTAGELISLIRAIKLTDAELAALIEGLELAMTALDFADEDIETALGLIEGVTALGFTDEELDFVVEILPSLSGIDFTKSQTEILNALGDVFKIRNVTVAETAVCKHAPNAQHTLECAWFDTVQLNLLKEGFDLRDLMRPESVDIYPFSIESRNKVLKFINDFNNGIKTDENLSRSTIDYTVLYTDELSQVTASMSSMINTITYILIGVAAIAVVVAMLLVAIILYISVQDRTKEIGLLRSLGASKGNVSSVFIAETFIIGLVSGIVGVLLALALTFPANIIIGNVLGISGLLRPVWWHQFALVGIAFVITVLSGLIPAALAAKKDPVLALRTE